MLQLGIQRPAQVQVLSASALLSGKTSVLAAETGSGKTLAYLGPIFSSLLQMQSTLSPDRPAGAVTPGALVLCPNVALCDQVVAMANSMLGADGLPLLFTARISSSRPPPRQLPDITVATPAGLIYASDNYSHHYGPAWTREGIVDRMHHVVFDEADLLLTGGFEKDAKRLLQALQDADRARLVASACRDLRIGEQQFRQLPYHIRRAAAEGGAAAMQSAGFSPQMLTARKAPPPSQAAPPRRAPPPAANDDWDADLAAATSSDSPQPDVSLIRGDHSYTGPPSTSQPDSDLDWRRQYIFAAATMPAGEAGKSVAAELRKLMPKAVWLQGRALHKGQSAVQHRWVPVAQASWASALQAAVSTGAFGRTIVFTSDVTAAEEAAEVLRDAGLSPLVYHRKVPQLEREQALEAMSTRDHCVMVCTDAAARGLDIPLVSHVVQATFAASAVDFLHRVGRTGRAGNAGRVTSLYLPEQAPLAEAIRDGLEGGDDIEGTFSRNRSFRNKFKRYGRYVPRGEVALSL